jgi:DNA-binding HxlR family transcriptional regulator
MRHKNYNGQGCSVEICTEIIGGKWKGEILYFLCKGTKRYGQLKKLIPDTTQRMLTTQLRELEEDGVITRKVYAETPPKVEYSLSEVGQSLKPIIDAMWDWGEVFRASLPMEKKLRHVSKNDSKWPPAKT